MLSPESFSRMPKRHVTDVIRVALERRGIIGFIEIHETMTLLEARTLIWENVENAPCDFQFVLDDGAPVSVRQESTQHILHFYPCVKIRECKKPVSSSSADVLSPVRREADEVQSNVTITGGEDDACSNNSTAKISVWTASGDEFTVWISDAYTFQQLRRDAARYWNLPAALVALTDSDGCLWPEQAKILSVMGVEELRQRKIILESKGSATTAGVKPKHKTSPMGFLSSRRRSSVDSQHSTSRSMATWSHVLTATPAPDAANPVEELWRVFTFYCVNGDTLELECIKAHQFNRLLRDARVLGGAGAAVTPAMADIIYTSETKGKPQWSGKMNYDEFLNALVRVAVARHRRSSSRFLQRSADTQEEDELFHGLVTENILPLASRWSTHVWDLQTQRLRTPEVVAFVSKFLDSLLDIFLFYAKSHRLNAATSAKEFHMSYTDYQRFVNDFAFAYLQVSSVEAAQVFVAACSSSPIHDALSDLADQAAATGSPSPGPDAPLDASYETLSCSSSSLSSSVTAVDTAFQKLASASEGVVLYASPAAQVGRACMSLSAFLDALGRLGLVSFAKAKNNAKPVQSTKAVFHHLSRGLTRSRVLSIMHNHGSASVHSGRFYSGSVAFNNKFLDMWRYEGSPDYLAGSDGAVAATSEKNCVSTTNASLTSPVSVKKAIGAGELLLSPSRRLASSAALFNERVVQNGAGRGREALDRLVRNAFIRNAISSSSLNPATAVLTPRKGDYVLPSTFPGNSSDDSAVYTRDDREVNSKPSSTLTSAPPAGEAPLDRATQQAQTVTLNVATAGETLRCAETRQQALDSTGTSMMKPLRSYGNGGIALHPKDEKALYESILLKGGVFKKYGQWGNPHRRFVWCSKEFDGVYWRPINKKHSLSKEGISVASFMAVLPGNSTRTRYAFMKHLSDEKSLCRCLSLVAEDRRLDLEADSEATRDLWMQALQFLMKEHRPRMLTV